MTCERRNKASITLWQVRLALRQGGVTIRWRQRSDRGERRRVDAEVGLTEERERDLAHRRGVVLERGARLGQGDRGCLLDGEPVDAGADRRRCHRLAVVLAGELEGGSIRGAQLLGLATGAVAPARTDSVHD